jgi:predicted nucleotidyltransferase
MELQHPLGVITPTLDGDILGVLARADSAFTGRQISIMIGRSESGTRNTLQRLCREGIVEQQCAGQATLYQLNRDHLAAPHVQALARLKGDLFDRIHSAFEEWDTPPIYAALFGSAARGDMDTSSDIDLFIVRPDAVANDNSNWDHNLLTLVARIARWTGNDTRPFELSESEVAKGLQHGQKVLRDVIRDALHLYGRHDYLKHKRRTRELSHNAQK